MMRRYQNWPGKNLFCCGGRVILGPGDSFPTMMLAVFLILVPGTLFVAFTAVALHPAVIAIGSFLVVSSLTTLYITTTTEPGIVPRAEPTQPPPGSNITLPVFTEETIHGKKVELKFCSTCQIYRPLTWSHCSVCDNCVEDMDHHCPWVGNCVGRRNYRFFVLFVFNVTTLTAFTFACSVAHLVVATQEQEDQDFWKALGDAPVSVGVCILTFFLMFSLGGLCGFHCYLLMVGKTTREQVKHIEGKDATEHRAAVLFSPIPKSRLPVMSDEISATDVRRWQDVYSAEGFVPEPEVVTSAMMVKRLLQLQQQASAAIHNPRTTSISSSSKTPTKSPSKSTKARNHNPPPAHANGVGAGPGSGGSGGVGQLPPRLPPLQQQNTQWGNTSTSSSSVHNSSEPSPGNLSSGPAPTYWGAAASGAAAVGQWPSAQQLPTVSAADAAHFVPSGFPQQMTSFPVAPRPFEAYPNYTTGDSLQTSSDQWMSPALSSSLPPPHSLGPAFAPPSPDASRASGYLWNDGYGQA